MTTENDIYNLLDKFINGTLSESEQSRLNDAFSQDPGMKRYFQDEAIAENIIIENEVLSWGEAAKQATSPSPKRANGTLISIAILVLAIGVASIGLLFVDEPVAENSSAEATVEETVSSTDTTTELSEENKAVHAELSTIQQPTFTNPKGYVDEKEQKAGQITAADSTFVPKEEAIQMVNTLIEEKALPANIEQTTPRTDTCAGITQGISVIPSDTRPDKETGTIEVVTDREDVVFSLGFKEDFVPAGIFSDLPSGSYAIVVQMLNGCRAVMPKAVVGIQYCPDEYIQTYTPNADEPWKIPASAKEPYSVSILSFDRKIVFSAHSPNGNEQYWEGVDMQGMPVATGFYKVFVKYDNGQSCTFSVTLLND